MNTRISRKVNAIFDHDYNKKKSFENIDNGMRIFCTAWVESEKVSRNNYSFSNVLMPYERSVNNIENRKKNKKKNTKKKTNEFTSLFTKISLSFHFLPVLN